jgi:hypothetical protein
MLTKNASLQMDAAYVSHAPTHATGRAFQKQRMMMSAMSRLFG